MSEIQLKGTLTQMFVCPVRSGNPGRRCTDCFDGRGVDPDVVERYIFFLLGIIPANISPPCIGIARRSKAAVDLIQTIRRNV